METGEGGAGGPGGIGGAFGELFRHAARIKERIAELQKREVQGTAGGGMVTATVNGRGELVSLRIEREVVNPEDVEMLQDLVVAAVNQAVRNSREALQEEISRLTGGLRIPGLF
jgi:hypothetical protein